MDAQLKTAIKEYTDLKNQEKLIKQQLAERMSSIEALWTDPKKTQQVDQLLVTFVNSTERANTSYADAFKLALTKVNKATQLVLNQAVEETKKITKVSASLRIKDEGMWDKIKNSQFVTAVKNFVVGLKSLLVKRDKAINELLALKQKLNESIADQLVAKAIRK